MNYMYYSDRVIEAKCLCQLKTILRRRKTGRAMALNRPARKMAMRNGLIIERNSAEMAITINSSTDLFTMFWLISNSVSPFWAPLP